jgi:hypothetical protein
MSKDLIQGKTVRFTFDDGPMAKKMFEHSFGENGRLSFHMVGGDASTIAKKDEKGPREPGDTKYQTASIRDDLCVVSYLSSAGYTLTTVLDFRTSKLVAFSSNEKMLGLQHGTFEVMGSSPQVETKRRRDSESHVAR